MSKRLRAKVRESSTDIHTECGLASQKSGKQKQKQKQKLSSQAHGKKKQPKHQKDGTEAAKMEAEGKCPTVSAEYEPLVKYMEFLQTRTENKLISTMVKTVDSCKSELNESMGNMFTKITESVEDVKKNLVQLEKTVEEKIGSLRQNVASVEELANRAINQIKEIKLQEEYSKSERAKTDAKVKIMKTEINELKEFKEKMKSQIEGLRNDMRKQEEKQASEMESQKADIDKSLTQVESEVDTIKIRSYGNLNQIRHHAEQIEGLDYKQRSNNLIVEGILEKSDEETKEELVTIISKEINGFTGTMIKTVIRLGKKSEKKKKKPRILLVILHDPVQRDLIVSRAAEIKKKADNKFLWINKDQSDNSKRKHSLVRACYKLLLDKKYACSMKGSTITYNGRQYGYDTLNLLPEPCTPFMVKTRETEDKKGLCFYSEHTYCSNFYPAKIKYHGSLFTSVEHAYQTTKVKDAGYTELAMEMMGIVNPYSRKKIGGDTKSSPEWKEKSEGIMEELIREKFKQNPRLRYLLENDTHEKFYEMTTDKWWATGVRIKANAKTFDPKQFKGANKVGLIIEGIKSELPRHHQKKPTQVTNEDPRSNQSDN